MRTSFQRDHQQSNRRQKDEDDEPLVPVPVSVLDGGGHLKAAQVRVTHVLPCVGVQSIYVAGRFRFGRCATIDCV